MNRHVRNALISVYHKDGIVKFAKELIELGFHIYSSGGTAKHLRENNVNVVDISTIVGGGPILGHRVVTLSREIHAGLLSRDTPEDNAELKRLDIPRFDLVCVDLYPLEEEVASHEATLMSVIEKTDIGGPTMIRAAAKGQRLVICDRQDRTRVIDWLKSPNPDPALIEELAAKAEYIISQYCMASAKYRGHDKYHGMFGKQVAECKYGENAHQAPAALFSSGTDDPLALDKFMVIEGTSQSYNNCCDLDRLLQIMTHIVAALHNNRIAPDCIAVGVKHGNACGCAISNSREDALQKVMAGSPISIFGGIVMANFIIDGSEAEVLSDTKLDGIVAPEITPQARDILRRKGDKCRFIVNPAILGSSHLQLDRSERIRHVRGGFLKQPNYTFVPDLRREAYPLHNIIPQYEYRVYGGEIKREMIVDMLLAWAIGSTSNSNTITLVKNSVLIGNGVGQQDRVGAAKLAIKRARQAAHDINGSVAYSDSFFPFPDGPGVLIDAGVAAILTSSGSVNDKKVVELCERFGVILCMIPDQTGRGFFGH